ncbi:hypothetical protein HNP86_000947 [Methanococcus maripaludis]|uniref:Uncharacterized protein n=1 Tax=Methanococcus maripaludis TaxID=39152 RepID=A0A7J9NYI8_METMI|nr:hypothetical protein [Methanococcus maripaludis]MBA2850816.1 hypothetical protein [Methanococcus maripaludis]
MKFKTSSIIAILAVFLCIIAGSFVIFQKNAEPSDNSIKDSNYGSEIIFGVIKSIEVADGNYKLLINNSNGEYVVNVPESVDIKFPEIYEGDNIAVEGLVEINYSGIMTRSFPPILTASSVLYYPPEFVTSGKVTEIDFVNDYKRFLVEGENSLCYVSVTNDTLVSGDPNNVKINSTVTYSSIIQLMSYPGQCGALHFIVH